MGFRPLQSSTPPALLTLPWRKKHWFPCEVTSKKQVQKFHTDDTSLPSAMRETWLKGTTNQEHYPDLGSDASSVGNFLHSFLGHHFVGKSVVAMKMLAVFSGYADTCVFSLSLFTSLLACLMIQLGRHVPYSVASLQTQFITQ